MRTLDIIKVARKVDKRLILLRRLKKKMRAMEAHKVVVPVKTMA